MRLHEELESNIPYRIAYTIVESSMLFTIASQTQDCERAGHFVGEAADTVWDLLSVGR